MRKHLARPSRLYDFEPGLQTFRADVLRGLRATPKTLPSKYFYDQVGSQLFEQICGLDEYYLTRTELSIMREKAQEMATLMGAGALLIEYGSGSSTKTRLLLDALQNPAGYVPIDISKAALHHSAAALTRSYPGLEVLPVCADYTDDFVLPEPVQAVTRHVAYFPGSTIGNFDQAAARQFLRRVARICQGGGGLLIGIDLKKDCSILHRAYNDAQGVTARFNQHLLERINQKLEADFQIRHFGHYAFYNVHQSRIEMHLVSLRDQVVHIGETDIFFEHGESIWTENSYKYTLAEFAHLAREGGFRVEHSWTDSQNLFSVHYLRAFV